MGLYVDNGRLMRQGAAYRGFGANYFSALGRTLANPKDQSYKQGFAVLKKHEIPYIRFMAGGFWPRDWKRYLADTDRHFRLFDEFVAEAEKRRIGLIPSLFWYYASAADVVGEPIDQLGNTDSKTHAFLRTYIRRVVTRYRASPAIWAWEIGNEYNLVMDLPNAAKHRPKIAASLGTPKTRTGRDELTSTAVLTALKACATEIRKHDPHRAIISGNSIPRPSAHHNTESGSWKPDTLAQYQRTLVRDNPDPLNVISVHVYLRDEIPYFADGKVDIAGLLQATSAAAAKAGKPLVIGEFGAPASLKDPQQQRRRFARLLTAIERSGAALACFWVFDHPHQDKTWNVTATNARAYQLDLIRRANRRLRRSANAP